MIKEFMRRAIALGMENVRTGAGGPFAAVIVKDGQVVAEGVNRVTATNDPTAHAEVVAIRAACHKLGDFQLAGCDLYTTCEPCPMCLGAIYWARPARVFYACVAADAAAVGFDDAFIYEELDRWPRMPPRLALTTRSSMKNSTAPMQNGECRCGNSCAKNRWQFLRCGNSRKRKLRTERNPSGHFYSSHLPAPLQNLEHIVCIRVTRP